MEGDSNRKKVANKSLKTEYLHCNFSEGEQLGEPQMNVDEDIFAKTNKFNYLEFAIQSNEETDEYVWNSNWML